MPRSLDWVRDGADWPNAASSRFVDAGGVRWHVQIAGDGPVLLLLHGAGAATHTWRDLLPLLAGGFRVIAPDLPGHGFTSRAPSLPSLPNVASMLGDLLATLGTAPAFVLGHSAGAAIAARMTLDGWLAPAGAMALNGAFFPFRGLSGRFFSSIARLFAALPPVSSLLARRALQPGAVERLMASTGSMIDAEGLGQYRRLVSTPAHVHGVLAMMAAWDLLPLLSDLPRLKTPLAIVAGERDTTVAPAEAHAVAALVPHATVTMLDGLGHLAHEEAPWRIAGLMGAHATRCAAGRATGLLSSAPC